MSENEAERDSRPVVLAREEPVKVGALTIDPAKRRVTHDDGREDFLEPRVMQVLVALLRARGDIITRDDLLASCWGGVVVGEDAINRVMSRLRRLTEDIGAGMLRLETVTRVGYRLVREGEAPAIKGPLPAPGERPKLSPAARLSIAVLPFKNVSGVADKEYLADAITEDLVTALSRWRWFFVIARHSSFTYKGRDIDPARIAEELGVRYILSGAVGAAGTRVRVNAHLIDASDGSNVWADKFDHQLTDVLALQDVITEEVAGVIEPAMLREEARRADRKPLEDFSALDCFYRGMSRLNQITAEGDVQALSLFRQAMAIDPDLALGYAGAARILYGQAIYGAAENPSENLNESLALAHTAIGLDAREAQGYFVAAGALLYLGQHGAALEEARAAIALNGNFAYAHYRLGQVLIFAGQPAQAMAPIERALRLSPYDPQAGPMYETLAVAYYQMRDYARAAEHARTAGRISGAGRSVLAAALAQLGETKAAAAAVARMDPYRPSPQRPLAAPYADPAQLEHLRAGVRAARQFAEA